MQIHSRMLLGFAFLFTSSSFALAQSAKPDDQSAKIVDQIERLVQRPNVIAVTKAQRNSIDSLEVAYLKMARGLEAESRTATDKMKSAMKFREQQLAFHDHVRKLMAPSQLDDFDKNAYAAKTATRSSP